MVKRSRAGTRMWCSHLVHTSKFFSNSGLYKAAAHLGHFFHTPSGILLRRSLLPKVVKIPAGTILSYGHGVGVLYLLNSCIHGLAHF